jgi:hypothetical protein
MSDKYRVAGTTEIPEVVNDICVCNAHIGAIFVGTTNRVFVRVDVTIPCDDSDWVELDQSAGFTFTFIGDAGTNLDVDNADQITLDGVNGLTASISGTTISLNGHLYSSNLAPSGTPTDPTQVSIHLNTANNSVYVWNPNTSTWVIISKGETVTTLINNGNGTYTYTNELGVQTTFAFSQTVTTLVNNNNGTVTYTNEALNTVTLDLVAIINTYGSVGKTLLFNTNTYNLSLLNGAGQIISTINLTPQISGDVDNILELRPNGLYASETITSLVDNLDGTFTYTGEDGSQTTISGASETITTLIDNNNGTFTYTNELGVVTVLDVSGANLSISNSSVFGAEYLVKNAEITAGELLITSGPEHLSSGTTVSSPIVELTPVPSDIDNQASITIDVVNPSLTRNAKAQFVFTGYPVTFVSFQPTFLTLILEENITINGVKPSDFVNHISQFKLEGNQRFTARTQGYSGILDLLPGQTLQIVISLRAYFYEFSDGEVTLPNNLNDGTYGLNFTYGKNSYHIVVI